MKKRILPLALALLMVIAFVPSALALHVTPGVPDSYKDKITIENGVCSISWEPFRGEPEKVLTITNVTSLGTLGEVYGEPVVYATAPTTVTVLMDVSDLYGNSVGKLNLTASGDFEMDGNFYKTIDIDIASGVKEADEYGFDTVRADATYVLESGYYVLSSAEGGLYIFVSDSAPAPTLTPTPTPTPTPAPPVAEPVPTTGSAAELKTTDGLVKVVPPSPVADQDLAYTVQAGEKLFGIAYNYYGSMSDATISKIYNANSEYFKKTKGILEAGAVIILPAKGLIAPVTQSNLSTAAGMYLVKSGDTLADIAKAYYGDSKAWTKIYEANKDRVKMVGKSPMIYEGQWLVIPE